MSKHPRRAQRVDGNQAEIVNALRKVPGVKVEVDHDDILVGFRQRTYWFEIKRPVRSKQRQAKQKELEERWTGHYRVVSTLGEILEDIGILKGE